MLDGALWTRTADLNIVIPESHERVIQRKWKRTSDRGRMRNDGLWIDRMPRPGWVYPFLWRVRLDPCIGHHSLRVKRYRVHVVHIQCGDGPYHRGQCSRFPTTSATSSKPWSQRGSQRHIELVVSLFINSVTAARVPTLWFAAVQNQPHSSVSSPRCCQFHYSSTVSPQPCSQGGWPRDFVIVRFSAGLRRDLRRSTRASNRHRRQLKTPRQRTPAVSGWDQRTLEITSLDSRIF